MERRQETMKKKKQRKEFYKKVKFKDKKSKRYLRNAIFYWAKQNEMRYFRYITNYVSHATWNSEEFDFHVCYPITISGMSLSDICIEDAEKDVFHIALMPHHQIIYFEKKEELIEIFGARWRFEHGKDRFYSKKISYTVEDVKG